MENAPIYILGISCYYHDSAVTLMKDGEILFAAQEERYSRTKHDERFPTKAVAAAFAYANITVNDLSSVCFYEKPLFKFFDRILPGYIKTWPRGFLSYQRAMQEWMHTKLWIPQDIRKKLGYKGDVLFTAHHESHAASSYFCSGFPDAAVVTVDGVGEWATTTIAHGKGTDLTMLKEIRFPHSLGLFYSAITYYLGFKVNSAEYKVMGLAPYGQPVYVEALRKIFDLRADGSFHMDMQYFSYEHALRMTGKKLEELLGQPRRSGETSLTQFHKDVAASLQAITNDAMLQIAKHAKELTGSEYLCLAGGVALNCVANGIILRSGLFKDIFIQPAAGDAGGSLGAALATWHKEYKGARLPRMSHCFLGNSYTDDSIKTMLDTTGLPYTTLGEQELVDHVSGLLEGENVIGWFQGRMEFGPRSLGARSIIADARRKENWQKVNLKIKFRESFRPFAPTVMEEYMTEYFDLDRESPYMLLVADVKEDKRTDIPAVTHVDGSARIQTVRRDQNPRYHDLLSAFQKRTGCPVIINTSFNVRGEPIVESPLNALNCFLNTDMDYLVLEHCILSKKDMPAAAMANREKYLAAFALD